MGADQCFCKVASANVIVARLLDDRAPPKPEVLGLVFAPGEGTAMRGSSSLRLIGSSTIATGQPMVRIAKARRVHA
jgi:hypothetical protein